jgi:hypothetical protein
MRLPFRPLGRASQQTFIRDCANCVQLSLGLFEVSTSRQQESIIFAFECVLEDRRQVNDSLAYLQRLAGSSGQRANVQALHKTERIVVITSRTPVRMNRVCGAFITGRLLLHAFRVTSGKTVSFALALQRGGIDGEDLGRRVKR